MKSKKKIFLIGGIALAVIIAIILCIVLTPKDTKQSDDKTAKTSSMEKSDVKVEEPTKDKNTEPTVLNTDGIVDDGTGLKPLIETEDDESNKSGQRKANKTVKPISGGVNTKDEGTTGGININGGSGQKYSCGTKNHHCEGPETHAYIQNLELEGCPYCGSHSCQSFYATDEWGNACYTPSKCPKYDIKKDAVYYCQTCGKKCGDGKSGTCVQFVNACNCPNCGKYVESWTCHSCK